MKGKNLERAVILGLLLSTGVYGTAWAEDYSGEQTEGITVNQGANDSHTVNGDVNFTLGDTAWITNNGGNLTITGGEGSSLDVNTSSNKIINSYGGSNIINVQGDISLIANNTANNSVYGLYNEFGDIAIESKGNIKIDVTVKNNNTNLKPVSAALYNSNVLGETQIKKNNNITISADGAVEIQATDNIRQNNHNIYGIYSSLESKNIESNNSVSTEIKAHNITITTTGTRNYAHAIHVESEEGLPFFGENGTINGNNTVKLTGTGNEANVIKSSGVGIMIMNSTDSNASVDITSQNSSNILESDYDTISVQSGSVHLSAKKGNNEITSKDKIGVNNIDSNVMLNAKNNIITTKDYAINASNYTSSNTPDFEKVTKLSAVGGNNELNSEERRAINIASNAGAGKVVLEAQNGGNNIIKGYTNLNNDNPDPSDRRAAIGIENGDLTVTAVASVENSEATGVNEVWAGRVNINNNTGNYDALIINGEQRESTATFKADTANKFYGALLAQNKSSVDITAKNNYVGAYRSNYSKLPYCYALVADGNKLTGNERTQITVTANGGTNIVFSTGNIKNERTVFATEGGVVNITGTSIITADGWAKANESNYQTNNTSQALIAGTYDWNNAEKDDDGKIIFDVANEKRSEINLNYGNGSAVTGDIAAGYAGAVNIIGQSADGITTFANDGEETVSASNSLQLNGNVLAANGGKVKLELGKGSVWHGRADDYRDAAENSNWGEEHLGEFEPVFSNGIQEAGTVDVTLKDGATWDVMGQSWLTTLDGTGGVIDMRNTNGDASRTSHAVHIGELNGSHTFVMDLDTNHTDSDMLYIKDMGTNSGTQTLWINSINGLENLDENDTLRFATVKSGDIQFEGQYKFGDYGEAKNGIMLMDNGVLDTAYKIYREEYDSAKVEENTGYNGGDTFDEVKPGNSYVEDNYAEYNWYLAKDTSYDQTSDAGKTIINMSRANYKNAIYMDRLNKRMGEMRYVNDEEEQGLWVRLRHDRIGQSGDFRSMNTMYEVGYDVKQPTDNGEHRIGMAIDYMRGSTTYDDIMGKGETKRYGLWLYDTWLGEKGHYVDYVAKWGHLSNDFDITAKTTGEKINGDYSNNVFSVSAEYGKKNDMGNNWYFEPQAQLQLARVTGADYVTTQGSKVNVDGINSLIGRAGFRIGRDMDENSTVYLKADLLHEFMGDQTVTAADATGTLREEFENKGTWYDVGFGFAAKMSKNSYAFMDFEKSFGNDNDETYQINAGMQWTF